MPPPLSLRLSSIFGAARRPLLLSTPGMTYDFFPFYIFVFSVSIYAEPFAWLIKPVFKTIAWINYKVGSKYLRNAQIGRMSFGDRPRRDLEGSTFVSSSSSSLS